MMEDAINAQQILQSIKRFGEEGKQQDYDSWLSFHDTIAKLATHAHQMLNYAVEDIKQRDSFLIALDKISRARNSGSNDARYLAEIACKTLRSYKYKTPKKNKIYDK